MYAVKWRSNFGKTLGLHSGLHRVCACVYLERPQSCAQYFLVHTFQAKETKETCSNLWLCSNPPEDTNQINSVEQLQKWWPTGLCKTKRVKTLFSIYRKRFGHFSLFNARMETPKNRSSTFFHTPPIPPLCPFWAHTKIKSSRDVETGWEGRSVCTFVCTHMQEQPTKK